MKFILEAKRLQKLAGIIVEQDDAIESPIIGDTPEESPAEAPEIPSGPISRESAKDLIKSTRGKYFTVSFIKKDGTARVMNARLGVKKYLRGGELPYDPIEKGLIPVYDAQVRDYRVVPVNRIYHLSIGGKEFDVQ